MLSNEYDKLKNICVIYHSFLKNTFSNNKCKLDNTASKLVENSMQIPERLTIRTGGILKIAEATQVPNSPGKNQYLSSPFHPRISAHVNIFQIDFHMLKYSCCNLNPTDQNQSALSLLKTTKQKVSY